MEFENLMDSEIEKSVAFKAKENKAWGSQKHEQEVTNLTFGQKLGCEACF